MAFGRRNIGLPTHTKRIVKNSVIDGMKIVTSTRTYYGAPNGFNVNINGEKYYSNHLSRDDAIKSCIEKHKKRNL